MSGTNPQVKKTTKQNSLVSSNQSNGQGLIMLLEKAMANPDFDVNKLEQLIDMQERILNKNAEIAYNISMSKLQKKLPIIKHTGMLEYNQTKVSTYAKYEDIDKVLKPLMVKNGFSLSFDTETIENKTFIIGILSHVQGHKEIRKIELPIDHSGGKNVVQAMGSTISYGKRYLVGMLINFITEGEDTDGKLPNEEREKPVEFDTNALMGFGKKFKEIKWCDCNAKDLKWIVAESGLSDDVKSWGKQELTNRGVVVTMDADQYVFTDAPSTTTDAPSTTTDAPKPPLIDNTLRKILALKDCHLIPFVDTGKVNGWLKKDTKTEKIGLEIIEKLAGIILQSNSIGVLITEAMAIWNCDKISAVEQLNKYSVKYGSKIIDSLNQQGTDKMMMDLLHRKLK